MFDYPFVYVNRDLTEVVHISGPSLLVRCQSCYKLAVIEPGTMPPCENCGSRCQYPAFDFELVSKDRYERTRAADAMLKSMREDLQDLVRLILDNRLFGVFIQLPNNSPATDTKGRRYGAYFWLQARLFGWWFRLFPKYVRGIKKARFWRLL